MERMNEASEYILKSIRDKSPSALNGSNTEVAHRLQSNDDDDDDGLLVCKFLSEHLRELALTTVTTTTTTTTTTAAAANDDDDDCDESEFARARAAMKLLKALCEFLKYLDQQEHECKSENLLKVFQKRNRLRQKTSAAYAVGSLIKNYDYSEYDRTSDDRDGLDIIETRANANARGRAELASETIAITLANEILPNALARLRKTEDDDSDDNEYNVNVWYVASVVRAIKALAMKAISPERELDTVVKTLLRECAFYEYKKDSSVDFNDDRKDKNEEVNDDDDDDTDDEFSEESDWSLPLNFLNDDDDGKNKNKNKNKNIKNKNNKPVKLLKIEALAALGFMAKKNPSGMRSRWQIVFPREFATSSMKKNMQTNSNRSLLASQKTLEKLMVFQRDLSVRSAACFAIASFLDSIEAKKYLAMAEMKEEKKGSNNIISSRRASFSTVSMSLGENAVSLCEATSYAWENLGKEELDYYCSTTTQEEKREKNNNNNISKNNNSIALNKAGRDKFISWLSIATEKIIDAIPLPRLPKRLLPELSNSIKSALHVDYSLSKETIVHRGIGTQSSLSSNISHCYHKETPILRCLGAVLSAKIGFESDTIGCSNARAFNEGEIALLLSSCASLWTKAGAPLKKRKNSLTDREVQETCEAFKALQKIATSENASKILFPNKEYASMLSPNILLKSEVRPTQNKTSKVAGEKILHASVKLHCAMLAAVGKKTKSGELLFSADIRCALWENFIDNALPACLLNASDEVTQLVKIATLRCLSETTEIVVADLQNSSNGFARIKSVFEAPLDILRESRRQYPSATRAEAMKTLASLLILDPKYFSVQEVLSSAFICVEKSMHQERTSQDFSKTLETNASLCAANIALCISRIDDESDITKSLSAKLTSSFYDWSVSKGDKVRANLARGLGYVAKMRNLEDDALEQICEALLSCASTGSVKTQWNSCVAIKILFENELALTKKTFSSRGNNAGVMLTRLLLTLIKTSENFKIRRESLAAVSKVSRTFLNDRNSFCYIDCVRVVLEALVQSEKQLELNVDEVVLSIPARAKYMEELKTQTASTFIHLLSIGGSDNVKDAECARILQEHLPKVKVTIKNALNNGDDEKLFLKAQSFLDSLENHQSHREVVLQNREENKIEATEEQTNSNNKK
jgi:hypothetical protein